MPLGEMRARELSAQLRLMQEEMEKRCEDYEQKMLDVNFFNPFLKMTAE